MTASDALGRRLVEPEWLDSLPPADPRALRSRRDLRRVNALMRNASIVAGALAGAATAPRCIVELGAGDGAWMARLACALPPWPGVRAVLVDRQDTVAGGTLAALAERGWAPEVVIADAFDWLARPRVPADIIVANLFLHHFEAVRLRALLALVASRTDVFVACEPRRSVAALQASRLLGLVGCSAVTRHDAMASVRAGFARSELTAAWPRHHGWRLHERAAGVFSHLFVAMRAPRGRGR